VTAAEQKEALRRRMRAAESSPWGRGGGARRKANEAIAEALIASSQWAASEALALFVGVRHEVDTWSLIEAAWSAGKTVYLPLVRSRGIMSMHVVNSRESLVPGSFGLLEPKPECPEGLAEFDRSLCVCVPGLAFTRRGERLGQGGGFYDRFLAGLVSHAGPRRTLGVAYAWQLLDELPTSDHDQRVESLLTESGIVSCGI
jgi:5-formyltetrahydrofolate cyclo-ligase